MNKYYLKYFTYLILSLLITFIGAFFSPIISNFSQLILLIIFIGVFILFFFTKGIFKRVVLFIFTFIEGILIAQIIYRSKINMQEILLCMFITIIILIIFMFIGSYAKDLKYLSGTLFAALITALILSIISIFINMPFLPYMIILIFCGYIAYDFNKFKNIIKKEKYISNDDILNHVIEMYLDIINIFLQLLNTINDD